MNVNDIPSGPGVRERIFVELERLRERYVDARQSRSHLNGFGSEYWIDRERWLVLSMSLARSLGVADLTTVPEAKYESIELRGCRRSITRLSQLVRLFAAFIVGRTNAPDTADDDFVNFIVVQPLLNPAFEPLFWLGLGRLMEPNRTERNLGEAFGAMAIDLSTYPSSASETADIRKAQVEWVKREFEPSIDLALWTRASVQDWTAHCQELLRANRSSADEVFYEASHVAKRMLAGID